MGAAGGSCSGTSRPSGSETASGSGGPSASVQFRRLPLELREGVAVVRVAGHKFDLGDVLLAGTMFGMFGGARLHDHERHVRGLTGLLKGSECSVSHCLVARLR